MQVKKGDFRVRRRVYKEGGFGINGQFTELFLVGNMSCWSSQGFVYQPYKGKSHPRFANVNDSQELSPLDTDFRLHINHTKRIRRSIRSRRKSFAGRLLLSNIQRKKWFIRIEESFDEVVELFLLNRRSERNRIVAEAVMEYYCSLIIFSDNARYWRATEEDVLRLRFPLSKKSRRVLCEGWLAKVENEEDEEADYDLRFSVFPY